MRNRIAVVSLLFVLAFGLAAGHCSGQTASDGARKVLVRVAPQYPGTARSLNLQGVVKADVLVAPNGTVKSIEIKGGHPLFVQSAQNALREWKWEPLAHETHEIIELKFTL